MFHRQHGTDLFDSAERALGRAEVMAQHRHREKKQALTALRREQYLADQAAAKESGAALQQQQHQQEGGSGVGGKAPLPEDAAASLSKQRAATLRSEQAKLDAVIDRMLTKLSTVVVEDDDAADRLLPHLPVTLPKVKAAVPAIAHELPARLDALFLALSFAAVVHDGGSVDGVGQLDAALTHEQVQTVRQRALHTFATRSETGDLVPVAHPSVVRLALATPAYRAALGDRATNVPQAWEEHQQQQQQQQQQQRESSSPALQRMLGTLSAVARATLSADPSALVDFIEGVVIPGLLPHLDHAAGSIFPGPAEMHTHLYTHTLRPELTAVVALAEARGEALATEAIAVEAAIDDAKASPLPDAATQQARLAELDARIGTLARHAAACGDVIDLSRTLLYRVLMSVEQLVQRRRNLATVEDHATPGQAGVASRSRRDGDGRAAGGGASVNVAQATSSVGAAQSHRGLSALIEQAADQHGLAVASTLRQSAGGHEICDVETAAGVPVVAFYVQRGNVFAARYAAAKDSVRPAAPAPSTFKQLEGGAVELIAMAAALARKASA